ncbi:MAG TPA: hypothetical protein VM260_26735, partial [Pirellula sp.]|nr:hypothetical protein [Pirellula sp.]
MVRSFERKWSRVFFKEALFKFDFSRGKVSAAHLESGSSVHADIYVLATNPFAAAEIVDRTPTLAAKDQFRLFRPLTAEGPHRQVSFRIAFAERISWPRDRTAIIVADSEFNLTLFAQEQAWASDVYLGDGVESLWTCTACVATGPGPLYGLSLEDCSKEQFIAEAMAQLLCSEGLDQLIKGANGGRSLATFRILKTAIWHEWRFAKDGIKEHQP